MANTKISQLPAATTPLAGTELVPIVQGGVTVKVAAQNVTNPGGSTTQIQYNNAGAFAGSANLTYDGTNVQLGAAGALRFADSDSSNYVAFKAPTIIGSNVNWTLPNTDGTAGQVLITNGSGVLSWATPTLTPTAPTNNTLPVVSGTPTVGETLSSTSGTWSGYPAPTFAYQWVRGAATNISGATSSSYQLQDADLATTVKCTVTATNAAGSASATSAPTSTIAAGAPQAPTGVTATGGNTQATISFTAPAITGGSTITSYTVTSSPGGFTSSGASLSQTVTGLTNGISYTFTVTATNAIGTGPAGGPSNAVVPNNSPSTVQYLAIAGGGSGGSTTAGDICSAGGGAGGLLTTTGYVTAASTLYTVTVGAGGAAVGPGRSLGNTGSDSLFGTGATTTSASTSGTITAKGGGGGGNGTASSGTSGLTGGSAGGSANGASVTSGTAGQGNSGGAGSSSAPQYGGGGGGGSGGAGGAGSSSAGGSGGTGTTYTTGTSITGLSASYGGGGGGGAYASGGGTATNGGGNGNSGANGFPGTVNTGGGGGSTGFATLNLSSGAGGSGIVIIAYPDNFADLSSIGAGLTTQSWNGSAWVNNSSGSTTPNTTIRSGYKVYRFSAGTGSIQW